MQYPRYPYELLGESASEGEVCPGDDEGDDKDEDEEDDSVSVEGEVIAGIIDPPSAEGFVGAVAFEGETRDSDESEECQNELDAISGISDLCRDKIEEHTSMPAQRSLYFGLSSLNV